MNWALRFYGQFKKLLFAGLALLLLYSILRLLFWVYNRAFFQGLSSGELFRICYNGVKQDFVSLLLLNYVPVILYFIADHFPAAKKYMYIPAKWMFILFNAFGFALNVLDIGYFSHALHRTNIDLIYVMFDSLRSIKSLIQVYWFLLVLFALLVWLLTMISQRLFTENGPPEMGSREMLINQLIFILVLALLVKRPGGSYLLPSSPLLSVHAGRLPLAQNSTYTLAYSLVRNQKQIRQKKYFSQESLDSLVRSSYDLKSEGAMQKKNVVIIILESFSRSYLTKGDPLKARTPFFDSLIGQGIFFPNAFANGFNSNQGIVSILGGLPAFLDEPFYYSVYANTPIRGIGNILKENGYNTSFFMGANRDHFGFEKFGRMAGIDEYHWRDEFGNEDFYDGNWGIFDEPFLQYGAGILSKKKQPFLAIFFNISSHPPFTIPPAHEREFNIPGQSPAQRAISYVDLSFRKFFETIQKEPWFQQTIFVFCADHYLYPSDGSPQNGLTVSAIPIFFYDPGEKMDQIDSAVISQVDLSPSILHLLHYSGRSLGFGKDIFDQKSRENYALNRPGQIYQIFYKDFVLGYDMSRDRAEYLYNCKKDPGFSRNLLDSVDMAKTSGKLENLLKANIQRFQQDLINRSLE